MRLPGRIKPWLTEGELAVWVREAPSRDDYQRRLAIWLTHRGGHYAHQIAAMLQVSKQAVWLWTAQYNREGPEGLTRRGRGGRRWALLSWAEEEALLRGWTARAAAGEVLTAVQLLPDVRRAVRKKVSLAYVYKLLHRHGWRKLAPRPHHVQADPKRQAAFKKTSRPSSRRR